MADSIIICSTIQPPLTQQMCDKCAAAPSSCCCFWVPLPLPSAQDRFFYISAGGGSHSSSSSDHLHQTTIYVKSRIMYGLFLLLLCWVSVFFCVFLHHHHHRIASTKRKSTWCAKISIRRKSFDSRDVWVYVERPFIARSVVLLLYSHPSLSKAT